MKQEDKNQLSRDKILAAAIEEFGEKGYAGASLNTLLSENKLSKGLVYHYFANKDQLYLSCVKICYDTLLGYLSEVKPVGSAQTLLESYFEARGRFSMEHQKLDRIFLHTAVWPPAHLVKELKELRFGFDQLNHSLFLAVLDVLKLRDGITKEDALFHFDLMQNAMPLHFRAEADQKPWPDACAYYVKQANKTMDILLKGLVFGENE